MGVSQNNKINNNNLLVMHPSLLGNINELEYIRAMSKILSYCLRTRSGH